MGTRQVAAVIAIGLFAVGCTERDLDIDDPAGQASAPIIGGTTYTTHQWVVAYLASGGKCSATIIAKYGSTGYALTAAHCLKSQLGVIRQGNNHNSGYIEYPVVETDAHPEYNGSPLYDFAMLRFSGATVNTPAFAPLTAQQDNLVAGSSMKLLGYGQTANSGGGTSLR
jgi:hypothetical protein